MKFQLVEKKVKEYSPDGLKKDTCYAVAYSICKDIPYEDALRKIPDGKFDTLQSILVAKDGIPMTKPSEKLTATQFASKNPVGTYLLLVESHAIACVDGTLFDTQGFENKQVICFYTFSTSPSHKETAFVDAVNSNDNEYIQFAIDYLKANYPNAIKNSYGDILISSLQRGHTGFDLRVNGKNVEFLFPFLSSDKEIKEQIKKIIDKNFRGQKK